MASTIVIDTISSTDTTASFNVVNFSSARYILVQLYNGSSVAYSSQVYLGQFRSQAFTVSSLSPGTTYEIRASSGSDVTTASVTTTGSPATSVTVSIPAVVRIAKNVSKTIAGVVDVENSISKVITGTVSISSPSYTDIAGCVNIDKHEEVVSHSDIAGRVRIGEYVSKSITGGARIARLDTSYIQGGVNIFKSGIAEISGLVRILGDKSNYITGRVRVRVAVPEKLPEDWEYSGTTEPEEWENIDKSSTDWSEVEKSDESWNEVEKDATSWSDGSVAGAEEWDYPLEDTG